MRREQLLATAFIELSDVNCREFEPELYTQLLTRHIVSLLDVDAGGWLLTDDTGRLRAGGTSDAARLLQIIQLRTDDGPGVESLRSCRHLAIKDLRTEPRWARFRTSVLGAGFAAVHSIPMRLDSDAVGSLCLFRARPGELTEDDLTVADALVQVATACLLLKRAAGKAERLSGQLQTALNSRVAIEQAKGILAERTGTSLDSAFELMRSFARQHRRRLNEVACAVVTRSPTVADLIEAQKVG